MFFGRYETSLRRFFPLVGGDEWKLGGGGASASALGDRRVCGSCLIRVTSMHYIKSIRMFEDDSRRFTRVFGLVECCMPFEEYLPSLGCLSILIRVLPPSFLARGL
jgi:hypothetical protein